MKKGIRKFIPLIAVAIAFSGCAQLGKVQEFAGKAAERQCEKEQWRRNLDQLLTYAAIDGKGVLKLYCPGDEGYEHIKQSAQFALAVFETSSSRDYVKVLELYREYQLKQGIDKDTLFDENGCSTNKTGIRLCFPIPAE